MVDYISEIDQYLKRLFPITRSLTGQGNRESLQILQEILPLKILEYFSGQKVYDWTVPREWSIKDAHIKNSRGEKIVDFKKNNLAVVSYSTAIRQKMKFSEIIKHLHYLKDLPQAIPYRTSYYNNDWGFCLSFNDFKKYFSQDQEYEVFIDAGFKDGSLTIGELLIQGQNPQEYLISTYICHPSLANDNLSGAILTAFLGKELLKRKLNFSYRIIFVPETIGAITYCANNQEAMRKINAGFVITCVGGQGKFSYKQSYNPDCFLNKFIERIFQDNNIEFITYPFDINGSDERQFSSIGFRINTVSICKDKYYEYPYYHTSLDNLGFVSPQAINVSLNLYLDIIEQVDKIDNNFTFINTKPNCEAMLSNLGCYPVLGGRLNPNQNNKSKKTQRDIISWLLFLSDGKTCLADISSKIDISISDLYEVAIFLEKKGILKKVKYER
ncbi:MAG: DUF4910 domain-containing protein [Candidatus Omnitrophica bacterium]|nr:DUF4910 domain-containing protein [Candidatus Omnitrophota bacterium]